MLSSRQSKPEQAALFIYLMQTCYNGLYRVNKSGRFNTPCGKAAAPKILDEENIHACSKALKKVVISQCDFSKIKPRRGDFVYFDPPYHNTFSAYDSSGFSEWDHVTLAAFCQHLHANGVSFMLSINDTPLIRHHYKAFNMETVDAPRCMSRRHGNGKKARDLIIRNYEGTNLIYEKMTTG